jgi:diadenosine tetraphosphate (Ap4A) HIT family hydrolase
LNELTASIVIKKLKSILQGKFNPDSFNIVINVNSDAGPTIWHHHIHIIPRYNGDGENARRGIRDFFID